MARLFAVVFGSVLIVSLVGVTDVTASTISCGSTLGAGDWELDSNLVCAGVDPVIIVTSGARLNLKGNSVDCGGAGVGIFVLGATDVHINNGHVHHCDVGIWLVRGGFHQLNALHVDSNHHAGIFLQLSSDNHLSGSEVSSNAEFGILIEDSSRNQLNTMIIKSNGFVGVNLVSFGPPPRSDDNEISSSDVSSNFFIGVLIEGGQHNTVRSNTVSDNNLADTAGGGIFAFGFGSTIQGNVVNRNGITHGGGIEAGQATTIQDNVANGNAFGITVGSEFNLIQSNTALGNAFFDLQDFSPNCAFNVWKDNTFVTANQPCIS